MNNNRKFTLNTNQNIIVEFTDERIIPASGLAVVGALLGKSDFAKKIKPYGCNPKPLPASDQKWGHHPHLYRDALYGKTIF
jgi:hypothetical protein